MAPRIQLSFQGCVHAHFHFFLFLFPRCIITLFIQSCQGFPSVWSLFAALLLPFSLVSHCLPFFIFHLTLQYSLSTSPHLIFHHPTPSALRVWQELQWLYWHFSVIFFFLNYYNFRSSEPAKRETGERDSPRSGIKFVSYRVTTVPSTLRKQKEHENQRALLHSPENGSDQHCAGKLSILPIRAQ